MAMITKTIVAALVVATTLLPQAKPAAAHTDVCAGTGSMVTGADFVNMVVDPFARTAGFTFATTAGTCVGKPWGLQMNGIMSGWCDLGSGQGVTDSGHRFAFLWVGQFVLFTGELEGPGALTANTFAGESCLTGANNFLLEYAADKRHCTAKKTKSDFAGPQGWTLWWKVCA